jgi:pimeloyl-ACP methyl ester carboxylesterase
LVAYVLVHGGGFSGSCWDELLPHLNERALAIDLPGRGGRPGDLSSLTVADFVASVTDDVVQADLTGVTLVGHSLAGLTLPGVAESIPTRLRRIVFLSCAVPPHGTSVGEVLGSFSPSTAAIAERLGDGVLEARGVLHPDLATTMFCNDMNGAQTVSTLARLVPESVGVLNEPTDLTGLRQPIPRTYVRLTLDASLSLETQDQMIKNLGDVEVVDLGSGHMAMVSHPRELAALLNEL